MIFLNGRNMDDQFLSAFFKLSLMDTDSFYNLKKKHFILKIKFF